MRGHPTRSTPTGSAPTLRELKVRASLLLKALRSDDPERVRAAAERFRRLPRLATLDADAIIRWRDEIRRKHALDVVAIELGHASWTALSRAYEVAEPTREPNFEWMFSWGAAYLNHWCRSYEEAREVQEREGGFVFRYRQHFVVCPPDFLSARALDPHDPDWSRSGRDTVRPRDREAFTRLITRLRDAGHPV